MRHQSEIVQSRFQNGFGYRYRMIGTSNLFIRREIYKNGKFIVDPTV